MRYIFRYIFYSILICSFLFSQEDCNILGDSNIDYITNVIDIISSINCILENQFCECSDINLDEIIDIVDIILVAEIIIENIIIEKIGEDVGYSYQCFPNYNEQFPIILYNHGGLGESVGGDLLNTCKSLSIIGYFARSEKRQETITLDGHLEEVMYTLNNLKNHEKADSSKIGIIGFSRGGLLSLQASILDNSIDALVLLAPATGNGLLFELYDSIGLINSSVLIQISENDASGSNLLNVSNEIYSLMIENDIDVEIIEYPSYDSNFDGLIDEYDDGHQLFFMVQDPYWMDLIIFLNENLNH